MQTTAEQSLRSKTTGLVVEWSEALTPPFSGQRKGEFVDVIEAAHVVSDEARLGVHRWVDAGRRAGMSWTEVGATLGISKQAAQQRFRSATEEQHPSEHDLIEVRLGPTAFNEMRVLKDEGLKNNELVRTGALALVFRRTRTQWEHTRVVAVSPHVVMGRMSREGWTYVSSWFPFHYFKRPLADAE